MASVITVLCFSALLLLQTYRNVHEDQRRSAARLAHVLAPSLSTMLRHDDVWGAYSLLRGPSVPHSSVDDGFLILLDERDLVFASDRPGTYRIGDTLPAPLAEQVAALERSIPAADPSPLRIGSQQVLYSRLTSDNVHLGTLLVGVPMDAFNHRFLEILRGGMLAVAGMLLVLIPVGWVWGNRMFAPLGNLEKCMSQVGREPPDRVVCPEYSGQDEISRLGRSFHDMLGELRKKQELERQIVSQERLAAIGRLTAGVAHEINNPLAGVLVALDTFKQEVDPDDARSHRTIDLLERGLRQIQETVSALLVECRLEARSLLPDDIDDLQVLLNADEATQKRRIEWRNSLSAAVSVPATPARQIILNLALNAVQSAYEGSLVTVAVSCDEQHLRIVVGDDGPALPDEIIERLFEPFESHRAGGTGLGLWVTYETIRQLGGNIRVHSDAGWTEFQVAIPFSSHEMSDPRRDAA